MSQWEPNNRWRYFVTAQTVDGFVVKCMAVAASEEQACKFAMKHYPLSVAVTAKVMSFSSDHPGIQVKERY